MNRIRDNLPRKLCRWVLVLGLLMAARAGAHGPFDHSSRLIVSETQLELIVTMGADAARDFLTKAGLAPAEIMQILSMTTVQSARALPAEVAEKLFEASAAGKPLMAQKVSVTTDGLESLFTTVFPRPDGGTLELRAKFFNGIEPMRQGSFVAHDENHQSLGTALLSRANDSVQITLPTRSEVASNWEPAADAEMTPSERQPISEKPVAAPAAVSRSWLAGMMTPGFKLGVVVVAALIVLLLVVFGWRFRRCRSR